MEAKGKQKMGKVMKGEANAQSHDNGHELQFGGSMEDDDKKWKNMACLAVTASATRCCQAEKCTSDLVMRSSIRGGIKCMNIIPWLKLCLWLELDFMSALKMTKPKEVVAGVWLGIMSDEERTPLTLMGKSQAAKEQEI